MGPQHFEAVVGRRQADCLEASVFDSAHRRYGAFVNQIPGVGPYSGSRCIHWKWIRRYPREVGARDAP